MYAVIMAGGLGTRISGICKDTPKSMIRIGNMPILEHQLLNLRNCGIRDIVIVAGHLGEHIMEYFGDGHRLSMSIRYIVEDTPLGTAGGLYYLKDIVEDDFFLINGDVLLNVDFNRFMAFHKEKRAKISVFTHPNSHPYDSVLVDADLDGAVKAFIWKEMKRPRYYRNLTNAGVHILSTDVLEIITEPIKTDLDREVISRFVNENKVYSYVSPEYVKDMGTPERLRQVLEDYERGKVSLRNISLGQKCIFLDRDGTINKLNGFISSPEQFELLPKAGEAVKLINNSHYLAVVVTNQPVIARGECSYDELRMINNKMETLLGEEGAYIDGLYFCPHHPDGGFEGEVSSLKFDCGCRKPKAGMLIEAQRDFNINFVGSFMIGDSETDRLAAEACGVRPVIIGRDCRDILDGVKKCLIMQQECNYGTN